MHSAGWPWRSTHAIRRRRRPYLALWLGLALAIVQAGTALGFSYTIPLSRVASRTTTSLTWKGEIGMPCYYQGISKTSCLNGQMKGTVYMVISLFREQDADPKYDYYVGQAYVHWANTSGANLGFGRAPASVRISSTAANQGQYDADSTATPAPAVCQNISVSASIGWFGLTATPNLCNSTSQRLTALSGSGATWTADKVANTPKWDIWWMTKVKQGVVPKVQFSLTIPFYSVTYVSPYQQTYTRTTETFNWQLP